MTDGTTRVFRFGVRWDHASIDLIKQHLALCDAMYDALAEAMNLLLADRERHIAGACPEYARLQDEIAFVDWRRNPSFSSAQRRAITRRLQAELKKHPVPRHVFRDANELVKLGWSDARRRVNDAYRDRLCWTHRGPLDAAVELAGKGRKTPSAKQARTWGYRIRMREHDGTGTLGGQTYNQAGVSTHGVWNFTSGGKTVVRIGDGSPVTLPDNRGERRRNARQSITLRLETGVYLQGVITMHRALPAKGQVKFVRLTRDLEGHRQMHHVLFTVSDMDAPVLGDQVAGLDAGWAAEEDGMTAGALALPAEALTLKPPALVKLDWVDELKGATDREQGAMRDGLVAGLSARGEVPEHLKYLARWKSPARLAALTEDAAFTDEEKSRIRGWARHRRHRADAIAGARGDALRTRDQYYHCLVRRMVRDGVGKLAVERGVLEAFSVRERWTGGRTVQRQRERVALSKLVLFAKSAGMEIVEVEPANTSRRCSHCGACEPGARHARSYVCPACGVVDHADRNAARNIRVCGLALIAGGQVSKAAARKAGKPTRTELFRIARAST